MNMMNISRKFHMSRCHQQENLEHQRLKCMTRKGSVANRLYKFHHVHRTENNYMTITTNTNKTGITLWKEALQIGIEINSIIKEKMFSIDQLIMNVWCIKRSKKSGTKVQLRTKESKWMKGKIVFIASDKDLRYPTDHQALLGQWQHIASKNNQEQMLSHKGSLLPRWNQHLISMKIFQLLRRFHLLNKNSLLLNQSNLLLDSKSQSLPSLLWFQSMTNNQHAK